MRIHRLLVVAQLDVGFELSLKICSEENLRVSDFSAFILNLGNGVIQGRMKDRHSRFNAIEEHISLVQSLLSLDFKKFDEDDISDEIRVLLVSDGTNTDSTFLNDFLDLLNERYPNLDISLFSLQINTSELSISREVKASFVVSQQTREGIADYGSAEWSSLIVQLSEFLITSPNERFNRKDKLFALGYSALCVDIQAGKRFLVANSIQRLIDSELKAVSLNEVLGKLIPLIGKYRCQVGEIIQQHRHPERQDLFKDVSVEQPSTRGLLLQYENRVKDSNAPNEVEQKLIQLVDEFRRELENCINENCSTIRERQVFVEAILGIFPTVAAGRPLRDWVTIYDLYDEPIAKLKEFGIELGERDQRKIITETLEKAQVVNQDIFDAERYIERNKALDRSVDELEARLKELRLQLEEIRIKTAVASEACRTNFKNAFAQIDRALVRQNVEKIIEEVQFTPPSAPPPLEPVFSKRILFWMFCTILPSLIWLILAIGFHWGDKPLPILVFILIGTAWTIIIAKRLARKKPEILDVENELRAKFDLGCGRIAELYLTTAILQNFNKLIEDKIQYFLEVYLFDLNKLIPLFDQRNKDVEFEINNSFQDNKSEDSLSNRDSFNRYYQDEFQAELTNVSYLFGNAERNSLFRDRKVEGASENYFEYIQKWVEDRSKKLTEFALFKYIMSKAEARDSKPLFLRDSLPSAEDLLLRASKNITLLNNASIRSDGEIFVFRYYNLNEGSLVQNFDKLVSKYFQESSTGNLLLVNSENPNRIGFLKIIAIDTRKEINKKAYSLFVAGFEHNVYENCFDEEQVCDVNRKNLIQTEGIVIKNITDLLSRSGISHSNKISQLCYLWKYAKDNWIYINDPLVEEAKVDTWRSATETIETFNQNEQSKFSGDCDDFAILMASYARQIGFQSRFVVSVGPEEAHAFAEFFVNDSDWLTTIKEIDNDINYVPGENGKWINLDWMDDHVGGKYFVGKRLVYDM